MDFIDGLPSSKGKSVVWVIVDRFTKYGQFIALSHPYSASTSLETPSLLVLFGKNSYLFKVFKFKLPLLTTPRLMVKVKSLTEYWYNSTFQSVTQISLFELLYGYAPPTHLPYIPGSTDSEPADNLLLVKELKFQLARCHLLRAQQIMVSLANAHKSDRQFAIGDCVFLKLQPYRQVTLSYSPYHKLTSKYFSPYAIVEKFGAIAYRLNLPPEVKIHSTFHISQLKLCHAIPVEIVHPLVLDLTSPHCAQPESVLARRMSRRVTRLLLNASSNGLICHLTVLLGKLLLP
ncbi:uncharacterized protein LOC132047460 [Lycium ferocissimum]|uniref:uncharacterized protein LOC132047460 n=1 Tax=Lycium ferocissimum TaxID=112874 RepID=UPI00281667D4|nr:uncharacterized protein LOC132047460 [Lycium ferocissimum]